LSTQGFDLALTLFCMFAGLDCRLFGLLEGGNEDGKGIGSHGKSQEKESFAG
jgi:hypothetical protein